MVLAPTEYGTTVSNSKDNFLLFCVFSPDVHGAPGPEISSPGSTTIDWHAPINVTFPFPFVFPGGDAVGRAWHLAGYVEHFPQLYPGHRT